MGFRGWLSHDSCEKRRSKWGESITRGWKSAQHSRKRTDGKNTPVTARRNDDGAMTNESWHLLYSRDIKLKDSGSIYTESEKNLHRSIILRKSSLYKTISSTTDSLTVTLKNLLGINQYPLHFERNTTRIDKGTTLVRMSEEASLLSKVVCILKIVNSRDR